MQEMTERRMEGAAGATGAGTVPPAAAMATAVAVATTAAMSNLSEVSRRCTVVGEGSLDAPLLHGRAL